MSHASRETCGSLDNLLLWACSSLWAKHMVSLMSSLKIRFFLHSQRVQITQLRQNELFIFQLSHNQYFKEAKMKSE